MHQPVKGLSFILVDRGHSHSREGRCSLPGSPESQVAAPPLQLAAWNSLLTASAQGPGCSTVSLRASGPWLCADTSAGFAALLQVWQCARSEASEDSNLTVRVYGTPADPDGRDLTSGVGIPVSRNSCSRSYKHQGLFFQMEV